MKIPLKMPCYACGDRVDVVMTLPDRDIVFHCSRGHDNAGPVESPIGSLVLDRAAHELLKNRDLSLTVIFAAMGFEAELSRLHHKWQRVAALGAASDVTDVQLDEMLRKYANVRDKINAVARLLHPEGLDHFVAEEDDLARVIAGGFPSLHGTSLAEGLQRSLFWPRNRILHLGQTVGDRHLAVRTFNVARFGILVYARMDAKRQRKGE